MKSPVNALSLIPFAPASFGPTLPVQAWLIVPMWGAIASGSKSSTISYGAAVPLSLGRPIALFEIGVLGRFSLQPRE